MVRTIGDEMMEKEEKWNLKFFHKNRAQKGLPSMEIDMHQLRAEVQAEFGERPKSTSSKSSRRSNSQGGSAPRTPLGSERSSPSQKLGSSSSTPELPKIPEKPNVTYLTRRMQFRRGEGGRLLADTPAWQQ
mmetsp:Transcript_88391/g.156477  ORF Transcript_88391/g.156477 Transcript_88391/m.156477 type:complete len:131 (-) Transcript_88391:24-416(-)